MTTVLFAAQDERWDEYKAPLTQALADAGVRANLVTQAPPAEVDYIVYAPNSGVQDFSPFTRLRAVLNLWAGVEAVAGNPTLTVPLARMVDTGLTEGMTEWVVGHVLRHHLGLDHDVTRAAPDWTMRTPPLARDRKVTILGLGALGQAAASALRDLNFEVVGWSRSQKSVPGIACYSGETGLEQALRYAEILVLLLPQTSATENLVDANRLALLPKGSVLLNPGRGPLIDDDALLAALDNGHVGHATLDVFRIEPLPDAHPYWHHPRVTVTPHIASATRAASASQVVAENIRRGESGEPFLHLVDRSAGY